MTIIGFLLFLYVSTSTQVVWTYVGFFAGPAGLSQCIEAGPKMGRTISFVSVQGFACVPAFKGPKE